MSRCRACQANQVFRFFSFGKLRMGNAFLREIQVAIDPRFRLDLGFCQNCKLVQQINPAPPEVIESVYRNYAYIPFGNTLADHYSELGQSIVKRLGLRESSFALDIGSNDGILLKSIHEESSCKILGIEPATRISEAARKAGVPTINEFFTSKVASLVAKEHGLADVVTITQVLQHIPRVTQFLDSAVKLLKPDGSVVIEGRYFGATLEKASFDTVYHEMIYFFTLESLSNLLKLVGMQICRAEQSDVYGGSLRIFARRKTDIPGRRLDDSYQRMITRERMVLHIDKLSTYEDFAQRVFLVRAKVQNLLNKIKKSGKTIAGYGAPSTGTTLLNFCGLGKEHIEYVVDDNPLKQGLLMPGTHLRIVPASYLVRRPPDYVLIVAWRLAPEIVAKITPLLPGRRAIIPLPKPRIVRL